MINKALMKLSDICSAELCNDGTDRLTMSDESQAVDLLRGQNEDARRKIAQRVGQMLTAGKAGPVERQAAESLARQLAADVIERVRQELAEAVKHAADLPHDIALKIAHDVDPVACPFLEVTEVFSDEDWQQLVLTISSAAASAVARRSPMSPRLALTLAKYSDVPVAENFVENKAAPMTRPVCDTLLNRFEVETSVLDKLAQRDDLFTDVAVRLTTMVSAAAREKLARVYKLPGRTQSIGVKAEEAAILHLIRDTPPSRLFALVRSLRQEQKLTTCVLFMALRQNSIDFFVAVLSDATRDPFDDVRRKLLQGNAGTVISLLRKSRIPAARLDEFWKVLMVLRERRKADALRSLR